MSGIRLRAAVAFARSVAWLGRRFGKSGSSLPGKVLLRLDRRAISKLAARIPHGSHVITATNGKTTTAMLTAAALGERGLHAVHNDSGANMAGGVAGAMLSDRSISDPNSIGLFEVDEFWVPDLVPELRPRSVLFGNLFRDQLDRYGELDTILGRWQSTASELASAGAKLILCADDPGVASMASAIDRESVIWFGIDDPSAALTGLPHASDSSRCRICGEALEYASVMLGHLGHWTCPGCGNARQKPGYTVVEVDLEAADGSRVTIESPDGSRWSFHLPLPGLYNVYNALGAWVMAVEAGAPPQAVQRALETSKAAFGRSESFVLDGSRARMMLIKNPTGANEVLRTLAGAGSDLNVVAILNDGIADGRDVSWIWDTEFELLAGSVGTVVCTGNRRNELALRLSYAGWDDVSIEVDGDPLGSVRRVCAASGNDDVWILATYTAMLDLRAELERLGAVPARP